MLVSSGCMTVKHSFLQLCPVVHLRQHLGLSSAGKCSHRTGGERWTAEYLAPLVPSPGPRGSPVRGEVVEETNAGAEAGKCAVGACSSFSSRSSACISSRETPDLLRVCTIHSNLRHRHRCSRNSQTLGQHRQTCTISKPTYTQFTEVQTQYWLAQKQSMITSKTNTHTLHPK